MIVIQKLVMISSIVHSLINNGGKNEVQNIN